MNITTQEVKTFINGQLMVFESMPIDSEYYKGVVEGLNMVSKYLSICEKYEGKKIADNYKEV